MGYTFFALAMGSISYGKILLTKAIAEFIDITKNKSSGITNMNNQTIRQVLNKPADLSKLFGRENKGIRPKRSVLHIHHSSQTAFFYLPYYPKYNGLDNLDKLLVCLLPVWSSEALVSSDVPCSQQLLCWVWRYHTVTDINEGHKYKVS